MIKQFARLYIFLSCLYSTYATADELLPKQPPTITSIHDKFKQSVNSPPDSLASPQPNAFPISTSTTHTNTTRTSPGGAPPKRMWNLRQANIRSVIQAVAQATHKNFIIDPRVQGKVSIISTKAVTPDELYQIFLSMLQVSGFAALPSGKAIKIVPNIDARTLASPDAGMSPTRGDEIVVQVVPVTYVSAEQLVPILRPLMPQWSNVSAYGPSNMLILSGRASNIKRLCNIIRQVDSSSNSTIDVITLKHALAMDVVTTLKALLETQKSPSYQQHATIAADDKSNTLLVSGPKTERLRIRLLASQLDKKTAYANDYTDVVYLKFLKAQDLIPILAGVARANFSGEVGTTIGTTTHVALDRSTPSNTGDDTSPKGTAGVGEGGLTPNSAALSANTQASHDAIEGSSKPKVQLIAEPNTNAIILNAPQALMRTLRSIIAKLDVRPAQVLVEAMIAEIDEKNVNQLGLEWGMLTTSKDGQKFNPGFAIIHSHVTLSDFQSRLYALVTQQKANILSTPSVVVLDNRQAKILVGQQVSIQDSTYPNNGSGGGVANPYTTFTRQNVALHLYVRPQISQGDNIQLQIDQGNDTLPNEDTALSGRPVINTSSIQTAVLVHSGDILVLGGLVQSGRRQEGNKLPILGDIPGLGEFFQYNARSKTKKVLMVFIRPIIMNDDRSNIHVTGSKYSSIRETQLQWERAQPYDKDYKEMVVKPLGPQIKLPQPFKKLATKPPHTST